MSNPGDFPRGGAPSSANNAAVGPFAESRIRVVHAQVARVEGHQSWAGKHSQRGKNHVGVKDPWVGK